MQTGIFVERLPLPPNPGTVSSRMPAESRLFLYI